MTFLVALWAFLVIYVIAFAVTYSVAKSRDSYRQRSGSRPAPLSPWLRAALWPLFWAVVLGDIKPYSDEV